MKTPSEFATSFLRKRATQALRQARKLPVGPDRNDLRQLAVGLIWLRKKGLATRALDPAQEPGPFNSGGSEQRPPALPREN
jgi:hypothetical protein